MITSNGGREGNKFVTILLRRLEEYLSVDGQALIYLLQLVSQGEPLVMKEIHQWLQHRTVELTPSQVRPISFNVYCQTYAELFPNAAEEIACWKSDLVARLATD